MPSAEQTERFRRDLETLTGGAPDRLAVAVSGGPDSLALLLLACAAFPGRILAATVDHGLRADNAKEAEFVASVCVGLGVPHAILSDPGRTIEGANLQAEARELRYRLLAEWAAKGAALWLATAHHLDDQAETVLMRLARGSGLSGLAAVRASRPEPPLTVVRPLLGWRRQELAAIVAGAGLAAVDDPSNRSDAHDRTRFRALLADSALLPPMRLAAAAAHLAEAEEALSWAAEREWQARAGVDGTAVTLDSDGLPPELLRRLASRAIDAVRGGGDWRRDKLADALATVARSGRATVGEVQISAGPRLRFEPAAPRRPTGGPASRSPL